MQMLVRVYGAARGINRQIHCNEEKRAVIDYSKLILDNSEAELLRSLNVRKAGLFRGYHKLKKKSFEWEKKGA